MAPIRSTALATNAIGSTDSNTVQFTVKTHGPIQLPTLELDPIDDSGIVGDNITNVHKPYFIRNWSPSPKSLAPLSSFSRQTRAGTQPVPSWQRHYPTSDGSFAIQLPQALVDGTISLVAEAVDVVGNPLPNRARRRSP